MRKDDIMTLTGEKDACPSDKFSRRKFFASAGMAAAVAARGKIAISNVKLGKGKRQSSSISAAPIR